MGKHSQPLRSDDQRRVANGEPEDLAHHVELGELDPYHRVLLSMRAQEAIGLSHEARTVQQVGHRRMRGEPAEVTLLVAPRSRRAPVREIFGPRDASGH